MQSSLLGQKIRARNETPIPPRLVTVHVGVALVGLVDVTTLPKVSTATHRLTVGQDTPVTSLELSTLAIAQAAAPPVVLLDVITFPPSMATHKLLLGQDTSDRDRKSVG